MVNLLDYITAFLPRQVVSPRSRRLVDLQLRGPRDAGSHGMNTIVIIGTVIITTIFVITITIDIITIMILIIIIIIGVLGALRQEDCAAWPLGRLFPVFRPFFPVLPLSCFTSLAFWHHACFCSASGF